MFFISFEFEVNGNGGGREVEEECLYESEYFILNLITKTSGTKGVTEVNYRHTHHTLCW